MPVTDIESGKGAEVEKGRKSCCCSKRCCLVGCPIVCLCCIGTLYIAIIVALGIIAAGPITEKNPDWGEHLVDQSGDTLTPATITSYAWLPGCDRGWKDSTGFASCGASCFGNRLTNAMEQFNSANTFTEVAFPSRAGPDGQQQVQLTAWWLPAPGATASTPRIVMTHGMSGTFNNMRVQVPAYMLRSLGFSVLLPNLRNHGTSGAADHGALSWGYDLWLDVLGAWDYAVMDPDGTLGGAIEPSQVGMFANSMGGFASAIAFAKETAVPAVWLDAPVWNPKDNLLGATLEGIFGVIHPIFTEPAWSIIKLHTGIDLDLYLPEEALKASSGKRPVYITQNKKDSAISIEVGEGVLRFLEENSDKYEAESWFPEEACNGEGHSMSAVKYPTIYREKLCTFFSNAFNMSNNCAANALPILEGNA